MWNVTFTVLEAETDRVGVLESKKTTANIVSLYSLMYSFYDPKRLKRHCPLIFSSYLSFFWFLDRPLSLLYCLYLCFMLSSLIPFSLVLCVISHVVSLFGQPLPALFFHPIRLYSKNEKFPRKNTWWIIKAFLTTPFPAGLLALEGGNILHCKKRLSVFPSPTGCH